MDQARRIHVADVGGDLQLVLRFNVCEIGLFFRQVFVAEDLSPENADVEFRVGFPGVGDGLQQLGDWRIGAVNILLLDEHRFLRHLENIRNDLHVVIGAQDGPHRQRLGQRECFAGE